MNDFEKAGGSHAAADAHGDDGIFGLAPSALDQSMAGEARASHSVGMTDRNRATIDVELVGINAELVAAIDHLDREGLIELPEIDVVDLQAVALEQPGHGDHRANTHLVGFHACRDETAED